MSTRSIIGIKKGNNIIAIYCHMDGYLEGVGKILHDYYKSENLIGKLMELGDLSILGKKPESKPELWDMSKPFNNNNEYCRSYKDRGEKDISAAIFNSNEDFIDYAKDMGVEYIYLFKDNGWYYKVTNDTYGDFTPVKFEEDTIKVTEKLAKVEDKDQGVVDNVYASAIRDIEKAKEKEVEINKVKPAEKHQEKGENPKMTQGAKKMYLDESLFN